MRQVRWSRVTGPPSLGRSTNVWHTRLTVSDTRTILPSFCCVPTRERERERLTSEEVTETDEVRWQTLWLALGTHLRSFGMLGRVVADDPGVARRSAGVGGVAVAGDVVLGAADVRPEEGVALRRRPHAFVDLQDHHRVVGQRLQHLHLFQSRCTVVVIRGQVSIERLRGRGTHSPTRSGRRGCRRSGTSRGR